MSRCGTVCDASLTQVSWTPVSGFATLFSEGTLVEFDIEHDDLNFKYSADGTVTSRTGKQATMITVTVTELACSQWSKDVYQAWLEDKFACGILTISDQCCIDTVVTNATVEPSIRTISIDSNDPISLVFKGLLSKPTGAGSVGVGTPGTESTLFNTA
ncbi:hypothetical protein N9043_01130 [bacterium]|nr:hypothetical protein [bacterium]